MRWRFLSAAVLACLFAVLSCSSDSTSPQNGGDDDETEPFEARYTAKPDLAQSAVVGESGGTVTATGAGGVEFTLRIPAGALPADTLITITPVSDLEVAGPGSFTCAPGCVEADCCVAGALFEPMGIRFDPCAALEVVYPAGGDFPFESTAGVFLFDSPHSEIGACETVFNPSTRTLTAEIRHFTGYAAAAADCTRLSAILQATRTTALAFAGDFAFYGVLYDMLGLESSNRLYDTEGNPTGEVLCAGLWDEIALSANEALRTHSAGLMDRYSIASMENLEDLARHLDSSVPFEAHAELAYDAGQLLASIRGRILSLAGSLAAEANSLCSAGDCEEGRAILYYLEGLGERGYITDAAFLANIETWIDDCCGGWRLTLSVDKPSILRCIINAGDEEMCVATVTARVTRSSGEPVEGAFIGLDLEGNNQALPGGESDAGGEYKCSFSSDDLGYGDDFGCSEMIQKEITADVYDTESSERIYADPLIMTFRNFAVSTEVIYTYSADEYEDADNFGSATGSITGTGTGYANTSVYCQSGCTGVFTRAYSSSGCVGGECGETYIVDGAETGGCILRPNLDYMENTDGVRIPVLLGLEMLPNLITDDVKFFSYAGDDTVSYWTWYGSRVEWPQYPYGIPDYYEIDEEGSFEPFTWTFEETSAISSKEASLSVTVEANH